MSRRREERWVAWDQHALDGLAIDAQLSRRAERVLRRLVLEAHWRDHTVPFDGGRTALALAWRFGADSGRRTLSKALQELFEARCMRPLARELLEVTVYDELVCPADGLDRPTHDRLSATWIRPDSLHRLAERVNLDFEQRSFYETLLTMAGRDGVVVGTRNDIAKQAHVKRGQIPEFVELGLLDRTDSGWRITHFDDVVNTSAARDLGSGSTEGQSPSRARSEPESRDARARVARRQSPTRAMTPPVTSTFGPCTVVLGTRELAGRPSVSVVPAPALLADEAIAQARSGLREARENLLRQRTPIVHDRAMADAGLSSTGTDGL